MGKWLAKFLADTHDSLPDIPDILPSVSGLSGPDVDVSVTNTPPDSADEPTPPIAPGWLVVYRDRRGGLRGGCDDRQHGTVEVCRWDGAGWMVHLTDGQQLPLLIIRAVGQTDATGRLIVAWTVPEHGFDGKGARDGVEYARPA